MKYYSQDDMKNLRLVFEEQVLHWPNVTTKKMFGCPCYQVGGKLFAFLVTNGIVITQLPEADRANLAHQPKTTFFEAGKKIVQNWIRVPFQSERDLNRIMSFVRKSYGSAHGNRSK